MFKVLSLSVLLVFSIAMHGQAPVENVENPLYSGKSNLETQYKSIMDQSRTYVNNKVVRIEWIQKFYSNVSDSLSIEYSNNKELEKAFSEEKVKVKEVQIELDASLEELSNVNVDKDSITLFGSQTNKSSYKTIVWSIIIALMILTLFLLYKFKSSNSITKDAQGKLDDIERELEEIKKKSRVKEQELMRKLQDEINKNS